MYRMRYIVFLKDPVCFRICLYAGYTCEDANVSHVS